MAMFLSYITVNFGTPIEETEVNASFHSWLGSVTERINQTMHYQFDGKIG